MTITETELQEAAGAEYIRMLREHGPDPECPRVVQARGARA